jgi:threonine dehydratase
VPVNTPKVKVDGIRKYGADLLLFGETYDLAERKAKELAMEEGRLYISPTMMSVSWLDTELWG